MDEFAGTHCIKVEAKLLDTLEQWVEGTTKHGQDYKPTLQCVRPGCSCNGETVQTTSIDSLVSKNNLGCSGRQAGVVEKRVLKLTQDWLSATYTDGWSIQEGRFKVFYGGSERNVQVDYVLKHHDVICAVLEKDGAHHFGPWSYGGQVTEADLRAQFLHKAERDCAVNLHFYQKLNVSVARFHYNSVDRCLSFVREFINDVVATVESDGGPILRVSDGNLYNEIPHTVASLTGGADDFFALT